MDRIDILHMRRALSLADRARGRTSPNPPVGAVVVSSGAVVGEGWHRGPGTQHAEIEALAVAGEAARGATLYLTLEPCVHQGRTPPCSPEVIASGVARVVVGTPDPNPAVNGGGIRALIEAGIEVTTGVLEPDAKRLIEAFAMRMSAGRPFVTVKAAISVDGRVAAADGSSRWITGPTARRDAHRVRASCDAIMVGAGTVAADDPSLTVRLRGFAGPQPLRVVLDGVGRTPPEAKVLDATAPTLLAVTEKAPEDVVARLRTTHAEIEVFPARDGRVDLEAVLRALALRDVSEVLLEGGPTLIGEAVERGFVDRFIIYVAPKLLGDSALGVVAGLALPNIDAARELQFTSVRHVGADLKIEAYPRR